MGNYLSKRRAAAAAKARSDEIDMQIEEESRKLRQECKVLLLGLGESGKTTIVKHMKIHHHGFTTEELIAYKPVIYNNLLDSAQALVLAMREIGVECVTLANRMNAERIVDYQLTPLLLSLTVMPQPATSANLAANFTLPASVVEAIHQLWNDQIIPAVMDRAESYLIDNAQYFLDNALRIGSAAYVPTESDVLCARAQKGTGITETRFEMGGLLIRIVEVGGQRSQLKKWIHCFESVTSIIFCTALSEYGQMLLEDRNKNRLVESLVLFESVINSRWFLRASIILFLNKLDVFKIKLQKVPLERYFPEYGGGPDVNKAAKYILWRFMQANRARLSVYPHMTQATDRDPGNSRLVFAAVKETILQNALKDEDIL